MFELTRIVGPMLSVVTLLMTIFLFIFLYRDFKGMNFKNMVAVEIITQAIYGIVMSYLGLVGLVSTIYFINQGLIAFLLH